MKRRLYLFTFLILSTISFMIIVGCNNQNPKKEKSSISEKTLKEQYELQEKCGKRSEEWFKKQYGDGQINSETSEISASYENHYNIKQNKCFIFLTKGVTHKGKKKGFTFIQEFHDVNENKCYGLLQIEGSNFKLKPYICFVLDKHCDSFDEWRSIVIPYMNE